MTILLLIRSGDTETNPGLKTVLLKGFHWNLNGLEAHDFIKIPLLEAHIATNNFDIMCLSETFLYSSISNDDNRINITGYSLIKTVISVTRKRDVFVFIIKVSYL